MRDLLPMVLTTLAAIALFGLMVFAGDRDLSVPPPQNVAEEFVRRVTTGRIAPAVTSLTNDARQRISREDLAALGRALNDAVGDVDHVEAEEQQRSGDRARAEVTVRGPSRAESHIDVTLEFEGGAWKVAAWSQ